MNNASVNILLLYIYVSLSRGCNQGGCWVRWYHLYLVMPNYLPKEVYQFIFQYHQYWYYTLKKKFLWWMWKRYFFVHLICSLLLKLSIISYYWLFGFLLLEIVFQVFCPFFYWVNRFFFPYSVFGILYISILCYEVFLEFFIFLSFGYSCHIFFQFMACLFIYFMVC